MMASAQQSKKKCRQYNVEYLKFGFIPQPGNQQLPMCLLCETVFSNKAMKPSRLLEHMKTSHSDKVDKNLAYFQSLRNNFLKRKSIGSMFASTASQSNDGLRASYNISLLIAKCGKSHTIRKELILPAISEVIQTVLHKPPGQIIKSIPLSNNSVQRRVDEMGKDIEDNLCAFLKTMDFSLQVDESTLPGNESLLLAYLRFIKDETICQELLFAKTLETDTKGESVFFLCVIESFFKEKNIPLTNIVACATDGAPAMVGRHRGFLSFLKKAVPGLLTVHCVIHRQHLVAKNLSCRLSKSLSTVITCVNKIKAHALNSRLFQQLCLQNEEDFQRLLLHTEVRWLSKGNCLKRFFALFDSVKEFFETPDSSLSEELVKIKCDIAYLTDIFTKFNEINLQLQRNEVNLVKAKSTLSAFLSKLHMFRCNLGRREFCQFSCLAEVEKDKGISDDNLQVFCEHLSQLHKDISNRFQALFSLEIPDWVINPFINIEDGETAAVEEELIAMQNDIELRPKLKKSYQAFWLQNNIVNRYPALWNKVKLLFFRPPNILPSRKRFQ